MLTLESLQFKIRIAIWVINFGAIIAGAIFTKVPPLIYAPFFIANLIYAYLLLKQKYEFVLGIPYLFTTVVMVIITLREDNFYLRALTAGNGVMAIYVIQGFSPYLTIIMAISFLWVQKAYVHQLTSLYEPITDSYRLPALAIERFISGWNFSIIFEVLCLVTYQVILQKVWKQYQATKQSLEQTLIELKETNIKLEKTILELDTSNKQLKQALESQDLFVACVSHELRNPLNALLGSLDLLDLGVQDQSQKDNLKVARICGESLLGHINNLLDVAKINADKLEINEICTKLSMFLEKFWSFTKIGLTKKGLLGHLQVDKNLPLWIRIDEVRLQQILENIVGNAIKFTTTGSIRVTLSWTHKETVINSFDNSTRIPNDDINTSSIILDEELIAETEVDEGLRNTSVRKVNPRKLSHLRDFISFKHDSPVKDPLEQNLIKKNPNKEGWLQVDVVDTGCGITEEACKKIFQPFIQGDSSVTRKYGGTGLGLYIVKKLIEKMGGSIRLKSVKDVGTQFKILLPLKKMEDGAETRITRMKSQTFGCSIKHFEKNKSDKEDLSITTSESSTSFALIVDDDAFNQNIMKNYFETLGFEVDIAPNGLVGLQMLEKNPAKYMFITMDIQMPVMDGITACKRIRNFERQQRRENTPIIIVTGNCSEAEQKACLEDQEIGANYFFRKPFRFSDCKICVQKIMVKKGIALK